MRRDDTVSMLLRTMHYNDMTKYLLIQSLSIPWYAHRPNTHCPRYHERFLCSYINLHNLVAF